MNLSDHFQPAEIAQLQAELDAEDRAFRRKVWTVAACGGAAVLIVAAGIVAGVVG